MENLEKEISKNCEEKIIEHIEDNNFSITHSVSSVPCSKTSLITKSSPENEELIHLLEDLEDKIGTTEYDIDSWNAGVKNDLLVFSKYLENTARVQSFFKCNELLDLLEKRTKLQEELISSKLCYNDSKLLNINTNQKYKETSKALKEHSWLDTEKTNLKCYKLSVEIESHKLQCKLLNDAIKNLRKWDKKRIDNINKCLLSPNCKVIQNLINDWLKHVIKINKSLEKDILSMRKKTSKQDKVTENIQKKIRSLLNPTGLKVRYSVAEENQISYQVLEEGNFKPSYKDEEDEGKGTKFFKSLAGNEREEESSNSEMQFLGITPVGIREKSDLQRDMNSILKEVDELQIEPMPTEKIDLSEIKPEVFQMLPKNEEENSIHDRDKQEDGNSEILTLIKKIDNIELSFIEIKQNLLSKIDDCEKSEKIKHIDYFCEKFKELMQLQERYNSEVYKKVDLLQQENKFLSEGVNINLDRINYEINLTKQKLEKLHKDIENLDRENSNAFNEIKNEVDELKRFTEDNTQSISELKDELNSTKINIGEKLESLKNEIKLIEENKKNQENSENKLIQKELNYLKMSTEKYTNLMNDQLKCLEKSQQNLEEAFERDNLKNKISELRQHCERVENQLRLHLGQIVEHKGDDDLVTSLKLPWDETAVRSISDNMRALLSHRATFSQVPNCIILHQIRELQASNFSKYKQNNDFKTQERKPCWKP